MIVAVSRSVPYGGRVPADEQGFHLLLDEQLAKTNDHREPLWTLLVFQRWYEDYIDNATRAETTFCN